jgi:biotin carboxyl carrier protein
MESDFFRFTGARSSKLDLVANGQRIQGTFQEKADRDEWDQFEVVITEAAKASERDAQTRQNGANLRGEVRTLSSIATIVEGDGDMIVIRNNRQTRVSLFNPFDVDLDAMDDAGGATVKSPMHGKLIALMVKAGDAVTKGQKLAIVEAMKMEHALVAPRDGTIAEVIGEAGAQVGEGARIVVLADA